MHVGIFSCVYIYSMENKGRSFKIRVNTLFSCLYFILDRFKSLTAKDAVKDRVCIHIDITHLHRVYPGFLCSSWFSQSYLYFPPSRTFRIPALPVIPVFFVLSLWFSLIFTTEFDRTLNGSLC